MKPIIWAMTAMTTVIVGVALAPAAVAAPRPQICQLLDVGLTPTAVGAALATQDGAAWGGEPYPGSYVGVYYTTVAQQCPEYCDGIEVSCQ